MFIIIILLIGFFIFAIVSMQNDKIEDKTNGLRFSSTDLIFIGGFPDREGGKRSLINVYNNYIEIFLERNLEKTIFNPNLINCEIISKEQLDKDISIGRVLMFGVIGGLLFKKDKLKVRNFIKLTFKDGNNERNLIFTSENKIEELTRNIRNSIQFA